MAKLKIEDLEKISGDVRRKMNVREGAGRVKITVHMGTCGIASGARNIMSAFLNEIEKNNFNDVIITNTVCYDLFS